MNMDNAGSINNMVDKFGFEFSRVTITQKPKRGFDYDCGAIVRYILYILAFSLPVFALPLATRMPSDGKFLLFYVGVSLALLCWFFDILRKGEANIPKSLLILSLWILPVVWFLTSLFSSVPKISFAGHGYMIDSFLYILFAVIASFLVSIFLRTERRTLFFYVATFAAAVFVFFAQFIRVVFGVNVLPASIFSAFSPTLIGGWNDFAVFFGLIALISVVFFDLARLNKRWKIFLVGATICSLLAMAFVGFSACWMIFGFFTMVLTVYLFSRFLFEPVDSRSSIEIRRMIYFSFIVFLFSVFAILAGSKMQAFFGELSNTISAQERGYNISARGDVFDVSQSTLKESPLLGSGPGTFFYEWLKYRAPMANKNAGLWFSIMATNGFLGISALLFFFACFLIYGLKVLTAYDSDLIGALTISSYLSAFYLWGVAAFYTPNMLILTMAFLMTGLLVAVLTFSGKVETIRISFFRNPKIGFISILGMVVFIMGGVSALYFFAQKSFALYDYERAVGIFKSTGDVDKTGRYLTKASLLDTWDEYSRALSELGLIKIQQLSSQKLSDKELADQIRTVLTSTIKYAQLATNIGPGDPTNWMQLGRVYEAFVPLGVIGSDTFALSNYDKAIKLSPFDPLPLLASARVKVQMKQLNEAKGFLEDALKIKPDLAQAVYMLSQIEVQQGNIKEAIVKTERTAMLVPNDIGVLFQLGLLYYQNNNFDLSQLALERTVALSPYYANARYFLGLIYDKQGMKEKAIEQFENIEQTNTDNQEVKHILENLRTGKVALDGIAPVSKTEAPISEKSGTLKATKKK